MTALQPRPLVPFSAAKRWRVWWTRWLLNIAGAIPLQPGEMNLNAFRSGLRALEEGKIVLIAPEGTRSGDGKLQKGHPGITLLAMRSGAPILPLAFYGHVRYKENLLRLRKTDFHFVVGRPFTLDAKDEKVDRSTRQHMVDEIMAQMAIILPPENRGSYANSDFATEKYLKF